jgi:phage-related protein
VSQPIVSTLVTELQGQSQSSSLITVFEVEVANSDIGGGGIDKLYFHDGATADLTDNNGNLEWYSLLDDTNFGSTSSAHYGEQTYSAFPVESEGWEIRGTGS